MAYPYTNISGEASTIILDVGASKDISSINICNTHASCGTLVDLYVGTVSKGGTAAVSYYFLKNYFLKHGDYVSIENNFIRINNKVYGLFIKLTGINTSSPTVDVIIQ